ncbi:MULTISPECIES: hypothetical protein [Chryseobacterium]|uniref:Uncharacterized protein n=1 Tax=Chryseobacterium camelliae TaxID=1265445 RepID=A0ABU0TIP1_9FLAO|nr:MULTISPECIES: hypothetical protein [Chryseobacterium]MDT3406165.1 hypothetical protein [Pseudacidovorax intermedius]MDQ1096033.1 hypothetical protein [Chryseobacterium camelliae]MDQ1099969.1 hypothetical protein [Chryseobacterium sp. SORGH_AS_1048]MDR6087315.1 hypothetical protein [Chryseobacterium sp. SORGH_AS_0909]MDR6131690.1 hypothetical protein [Chryseobacterium sp. SORGH_AS_1175]
MQFIDFTTDHLTYDDGSQKYYIEIPKDEIGDADITVQLKQEDGTYAEMDSDIEADFNTVRISMDIPVDFRVQF